MIKINVLLISVSFFFSFVSECNTLNGHQCIDFLTWRWNTLANKDSWTNAAVNVSQKKPSTDRITVYKYQGSAAMSRPDIFFVAPVQNEYGTDLIWTTLLPWHPLQFVRHILRAVYVFCQRQPLGGAVNPPAGATEPGRLREIVWKWSKPAEISLISDW